MRREGVVGWHLANGTGRGILDTVRKVLGSETVGGCVVRLEAEDRMMTGETARNWLLTVRCRLRCGVDILFLLIL